MMKKRYLLLITILVILSGIFVACSSQLKAAQKDLIRGTTRTPFQSIATFTATNTPLTSVGDALSSEAGLTATSDPSGLEETSDGDEMEEATFTATSTPDPEKTSSGPAPTATSDSPTSTAKPTKPPATVKPTLPSVKTNTPKPVAATNTPRPPADTNTPNPPGDTNTPKPPADTNTPLPPADTNTPVPPADTNTPVPPTETSPPGECVFSGNSSYESQVITLINKERTDRGLSALTQNSKLTLAARLHSQDMACNDNWSHIGSDGSTLGQRLLAVGYSYSWAAENIATSSSQYFSPSSVVNMWMNSPGHRSNILSPNAVHIGVGFRYAGDVNILPYDAYYTADFGAPR